MKKLFSEIPVLHSERLVLRPLTNADADALRELASSTRVYRYLPTFLFEQKYEDIHTVIERLYTECFRESIILGIFEKQNNDGQDSGNCCESDSETSDQPENSTCAKTETDKCGESECWSFCGLAEMYGYREPIHKISVGYRLLERCWGRGIASEALRLMIDYLDRETDIEIITASTMIENQASANVLKKNGFTLVVSAVGEDWGYEQPTISDKWIR